MITLNQTPGTNAETIWCLKLRGEGNNLVTLGDFSASTGWTMTGDWAIGSGVATYTYVDDATGALYRTLIAAEAVSYILEYEVTNVSGPFWTLNAADLTVNGGGTYFFASSVKLDSTLGKHLIQLKGNSGGTELRFTITDVDALDTISIDNIKVKKAENTVYLATQDLTLDNTYDGQVLNYGNYLGNITNPSTIKVSGGTGAVTSYSFSISRYVGNAAFNSFFNELYPNPDGGRIVSRIVDIGICWVGVTGDNEISWLMRGRIIDYDYEQRRLNFTVFQESELTNRQIPYYNVQKDFNNGISYYPYAPDENAGVLIPVVYGSFNVDTFDYDLKKIAPSICVDKRYFTFAQASHKLFTQNSPTYSDALYKYIQGVDTYLVLIPDNGSAANNNYLATTRLLGTTRVANELIKGKLFIVPKSVGFTSDYNDIESILDRLNSTYIVVADGNELSIRSEGEANNGDVGVLGQAAADVQLFASWQSNDGGNRQITLKYWNQGLSTAAYGSTSAATTTQTGGTWVSATFNFGDSTASKNNSNLPWTVEEICNLDYVLANTSGAGATSGNLNVRQVVIILSNIIVSSLLRRAPYTGPHSRSTTGNRL